VADRKYVVAAELRANTGKLDRDLLKAVGIAKQRGAEIEKGITGGGGARAATLGSKGAKGGAFGGVGGTRGMATGALAFGGVYGLQAQISKMKDYEAALVDVATRGQKKSAWMDKLRGTIMEVSNEYGIGKEKLANYLSLLIDATGDAEGAVKSLRVVAQTAYAANTDMAALAGVTADLQEKLNIDPSELKLAFGILTAQADDGRVALDKMAGVLPKVLARAQLFGHTGVDALRDYGAALQFAARGTGSLDVAVTGLERMIANMAAHQGEIEQTLGISLKHEGRWKSLGEMIELVATGMAKMPEGMIEAQGGTGKKSKKRTMSVEKWMGEMFGDEAIRPVMAFLSQARTQGGFQSGTVGPLKSWGAIRGAGNASSLDARTALKISLEGPMRDWNLALNKFQNTLHTKMLPALMKLAEYMPAIGNALILLVDNFKTLVAIWAGVKMRAFIASWQSGAGGGGGGAGGPGGGKGRGGGLAAQVLMAGGALAADKLIKSGNNTLDMVTTAMMFLGPLGLVGGGMGKLQGRGWGGIAEDRGLITGAGGAASDVFKSYTWKRVERTAEAEKGLSGFMDLTPQEQEERLKGITQSVASARGGIKGTMGALPASVRSDAASVSAIESKLLPGLDKLTAAMLQMQTVMDARSMSREVERLVLAATNASRAGKKVTK